MGRTGKWWTLLIAAALIAAIGWAMQPRSMTDEPVAAVFAHAEETVAPAESVMQVEIIRAAAETSVSGKRILIYHTHTYEAYTQVAEAPYQETERWRSKDARANMIAVGKALAASLEAMGFTVVHDQTAFEPPSLASAYQRSLTMLEARQEAGEEYDLYIDLHRDAVASATAIRRTVNIGGEECARFMMLIGKGEGYADKPDWAANYALAERLTDSLNAQAEDLCRDIRVKTGRFNQHVAPRCVLIECGTNYNTQAEVLAAVPYLAHAIREAIAP